MKPDRDRHQTRRGVPVALLLAFALLFAQWTGLQHRIAHANGQASAHATAFETGGDTDTGTHHSCAAFDAATVGDTLHLPLFALPLPCSARMRALWIAFQSWAAPCVPCFSSRAPPSA